MPKKPENRRLDTQDKTSRELHEAWLKALEESALCHKELKEARSEQRQALDLWVEHEISEPLSVGGSARAAEMLVQAYNEAKRASEAARVARDYEVKAWEATGLTEARRKPTAQDEDAA